MRKTIISLILLMTPLGAAVAAEAGTLKADAPERYTVVPGDTLWGISGRYLQDAWKWPELWKMNQEQIKNPHRIYPGDVIVLDRAAGRLHLQAAGGGGANVVKLSPKVRVEPGRKAAVPAISPSVIEPFLSRPLVVGPDELNDAPSITATRENRVATGAGDVVFVAGMQKEQGTTWQIFRRSDPLIDPESGEVLGYQAIYLGDARVLKFGEQSTVEILRSVQEVYAGDRLLPVMKEQPVYSYVPRAPGKSVRGRIVNTYGSLWETGPTGIVALSRGSRDGLEVGHVLAIYRSQSTANYQMRNSPLYGERPSTYYQEQLNVRNSPLYSQGDPISPESTASLPDERYGLVMIFRTFDRAAFGLVMQSSRPVAVNDVVTNP